MKEKSAHRNVVKLLSLIVTLSALLVIIGWIFDIFLLKSISSAWISMKFDTAVAFFLSGITLYYILRAEEGAYDLAQVAIFITSLIISLFMGVLFFSALFGVNMGLEDLFIKEAVPAVKTVFPGRPSLPTMLNFLLIVLAGVLTITKARNLSLKLRLIGFIISLIGIAAICGYAINLPPLYYYITDISSAMAFGAAVLFVFLGIGLICL
ncbi:MAG: hypothetical protein PHC71_01295 [Candidatus Omnitrophica bacterium]|nr:hypothetical protein [Candidatus Omnitrophota bacterium]